MRRFRIDGELRCNGSWIVTKALRDAYGALGLGSSAVDQKIPLC